MRHVDLGGLLVLREDEQLEQLTYLAKEGNLLADDPPTGGAVGSTPDHARAAEAGSPNKGIAVAWLASWILWELRFNELRSTGVAELSHSPTTESMRTYTIVV